VLTRCRPATGMVRGNGVTHAPQAVLRPWRQTELAQIRAGLPERTRAAADRPQAAHWATWLGHAPHLSLPPRRLLLGWDKLAGHLRGTIVAWRFPHGLLPVYPPLSSAGLNGAASVQRSLVPRALAGAQPERAAAGIAWLEDAVAGWHAAPTPCAWGGKRQERRQRARHRRLGGSGAALPESHALAA